MNVLEGDDWIEATTMQDELLQQRRQVSTTSPRYRIFSWLSDPVQAWNKPLIGATVITLRNPEGSFTHIYEFLEDHDGVDY